MTIVNDNIALKSFSIELTFFFCVISSKKADSFIWEGTIKVHTDLIIVCSTTYLKAFLYLLQVGVGRLQHLEYTRRGG